MAHYPGYTVLRTEPCPEQHGTLTLLTHDVSGAAVLLVENEDVNKAFGIGFGTFPSDDTGVFHILEHSVLAGSEKYPVSSPFVQLLKSSMASFLNAMTFPDKTVYPFATPNETDFCNLMDVYLNAVFCPLAMVDSAVFEQEGWHRDADGTVSGVVYNEMQGALASPDAQLQNALQRAMFPDTAYGFVSGGDPASIPALTYEKYQRVYRRHYSADNCCITLYGKMDMAEKLAFLDEHYLSRMPKGTSRPRLTVQDQQNGVRVHIPYYTENPEPDQVQCALAWYTGAFADRERQLGVEIRCGVEIGKDVTIEDLREQGYKGFYAAIGCQRGRKPGISGENAEGAYTAVDFLRKAGAKESFALEGDVVVVGGGNVAIDAARISSRCIDAKISMFCLEAREKMPASNEEIEEALEEGIELNCGWGPKEVLEEDGHVSGVVFKKCTSCEKAYFRYCKSSAYTALQSEMVCRIP